MTLSINGKTYEAGELIAYVKELEKENAELEETLGKCAKMPVLYCLGAKETITKAKELLKWFVWYFREDCNYVPYKQKVKEAEQFLKDLEK